jgi:molybdopterin-guanine dinucleotide biosynthesis protein A
VELRSFDSVLGLNYTASKADSLGNLAGILRGVRAANEGEMGKIYYFLVAGSLPMFTQEILSGKS